MDNYKIWNNHWIIIIGILLTLFKEVRPHPQQFQENYIEEDKFLPNFVTLGQKYSIALGSTVVLPCKLNETEHSSQYVLAWKRNIAVLTAGNVKVTVNPRIRLIPPDELQQNEPHTSSYNLEIRDVRLTDAGNYVCQIGSMEPKEIQHTLEVLVPPKINHIQPSTRIDIQKSHSIKLECQATGNPPPKIIWSRKNNVMPNGEPNITSNIFEVYKADRHTVGHYICTADNRVGQPDTKDIYVNVLYLPEIEVEQPFVHTGVGFEAKLTCIVHAEPVPQVIWYKDTTQLGTTEQHSQQTRGNRYSLTIRNVTYNDLGNYTCQASNKFGRERASLTLSAIPTICVIDSATVSNYRDQYNISWTVQSYSPIREYRLFYRKEKNHRPIDDKYDNHIGSSGGSGGTGGTHYYNDVTTYGNSGMTSVNNYMGTTTVGGNGFYQDQHEKWKNIIIPEHNPVYNEIGSTGTGMSGGGYTHSYGSTTGYIHNDYNGVIRNQNVRHSMSYLIRNLQPSTNYEARIQARNDHDWNKLSTPFHFTTRSEDLELEPSAQPALTAGVLDKDFSGDASATFQNTFFKFSSNHYVNKFLTIILVFGSFLCL